MNSSRPDARAAENLGLVGHDAHDHVRIAVEAQALADNARVGGKARPPKGLRQDDDEVALGIVGGEESAADDRLHAERVEYARRRPLAQHRFRTAGTAHDHAENARPKPADGVERSVPLYPVAEIERRDETFRRALRLFPNRHQAIRFRQWQSAQQRSVDERKECAVRADADRKRQHDHQRQGGLLAQHPSCQRQILPEIRKQLPARSAYGDGRRHVRLAQRTHSFDKVWVGAQLLAHERDGSGLVDALIAELGVTQLEMFR